MKNTVSVKKFDIASPYANAFTVTVANDYETVEYEVYTNEKGNGLWIDGKQSLGTTQFNAGKNPAAKIRRLFQK
jgi:hypothetical protein